MSISLEIAKAVEELALEGQELQGLIDKAKHHHRITKCRSGLVEIMTEELVLDLDGKEHKQIKL